MRHKISPSLCIAVFVMLLAISTQGFAGNTISINFVKHPSNQIFVGNELIGPLSTDSVYWNHNSNSDTRKQINGTLSDLIDNAGASTGVNVLWRSSQTWHNYDGITDDEHRLSVGYLDDGDTGGGKGLIVRFTNIPYDTYRIYGLFATDYGDGIVNANVNGTWVLGGDAATTAKAYGHINDNFTHNGEYWTRIEPGVTVGNYWAVETTGAICIITGELRNDDFRGSLTGVIIEEISDNLLNDRLISTSQSETSPLIEAASSQESSGDVVSMNFVEHPNNQYFSGGFIGPLSTESWYWNHNSYPTTGGYTNGTLVDLIDNAGAASGIDVQWESSGTSYNFDGTNDDEHKLSVGYLDDGDGVIVTFTDIPYAAYRVYGLFATTYNPDGIVNINVNGTWVLGGDENTTAWAYGSINDNSLNNGEYWTLIDPGVTAGNYWSVKTAGSTCTIRSGNRNDDFRGCLTGVIIEEILTDLVSHPAPANGETDVLTDPTEMNLMWEKPTDYAPTKYVLYFRPDNDNWADTGNTTSVDPAIDLNLDGNPNTTEADVPILLDCSRKYYWKAVSYDGPAEYEGNTWSFTTAPQTPRIVVNPASVTVPLGEAATLTAEYASAGDSFVSYKWFKDGTPCSSEIPITGFREVITYEISPFAESDEGYYHCEVYNIYGSSYSGSNIVTVDGFETGGFTSQTWQHSGDADWQVVSDVTYSGNYTAQSGNIADNQNSILRLSIDTTNYSSISFAYRISSRYWDYLRFYIDGVQVASWYGERDWAVFTCDVTDGVHTFEWEYTKNGSGSAGSDCAWIDEIKLSPSPLESAHVMYERMVARWTLDSTLNAEEGNAADNWDGVYIDPNCFVYPNDDAVVYVDGANGTPNGAVQFNGNLMIEIPNSSEFFNFHPQGLTLTAWLLGPSGGTWHRPVDKLYSYSLVQHNSNDIYAQLGQSAWKNVVPADEGSEYKWRFVAMTYDPNTKERITYGVYDDDDIIDMLHSVVVLNPAVASGTSNLRIGGRTPGDAFNYEGSVDDVRVYNYALTADEIQDVFAEISSKCLCMNYERIAPYDSNKDCEITILDFAAFAENWLETNIVSP